MNNKDEIIIDAVVNAMLERHGKQSSQGWLLRGMNVSSTDEEIDELYERLQAADNTIRYLALFLIKEHTDLPWIDVMEEASPEVEKLYDAILQRTKITSDPFDKVIKVALIMYDNDKQSYKYIKRKYIENLIQYKQIPYKKERHFIVGKILKAIIKDSGYKKSIEKLMKAYRKDIFSKINKGNQ